MKNLFVFIISVLLFAFPPFIYADAVTDNALNYLKSKQDQMGKITSGFSSPSQWAAIAFAANEIDTSNIKNPTTSLKDFLLTDLPTNGSATDWESRILAIVAIGENPTNFGGQNYIQNLESFYNNNQLGDTCSLNDDIFGLLALIASGSSSTTSIKQSVLDFIVSKQDSSGGFSWAAPGCNNYGTSADMTSATLQALQAAKDNGFTNTNLDTSINNAKTYLLASQNSDGGFGYFGASDADTTSWAMMALNGLGMKESTPSARAKTYLISQQQSGGGFLSYGGTSSTTTAQSIIALSGKSWVIKIYTPQATSSATPTPTVSPLPTPTPSSTSSPTASPTSSPTLTSTPTPTTSPTPTPLPFSSDEETNVITTAVDQSISSSTPTPEVLGINTENPEQKENLVNPSKVFFSIFSLVNFMGAGLFWKFKF